MIARTRIILVGLAIVAGRDASVASAQDDVISEISRAWQARQDRCASGTFRWNQDEFYEKGAWGSNDRVDSIIVDYEFEFKQDGLCMYSLDGLRWNTDTKQFDHETLQNATYFGDVKMLFAGQRHGRFPAGFINSRQTMEWGENYNIEPPLFAFRPLAAGISWFSLAEWDLVSDADELNGRRCVHLARRSGERWPPEHLWLDPQREYLPVRHDWLLETGELFGRLDTEYAAHEVAGWAPQSWRYIRAGQWDNSGQWQQKVTEGFTSTVTELQLNVDIPDSRFDITFPPGTRIRNEKTGGTSIVREDGTIRPVDQIELQSGDKTWDELMHSDPPSVMKRRRRIRFWSLVTAGIVCAVGIVFYWRHRSV